MLEFLLHRFDDFGTLSRTIYVAVLCEQCQHRYGYALTRSCRMIGDRYFWQRPDKARAKALAEAELAVAKKLAKSNNLVPCPACGWIQQAMLEKARREYSPGQTLLARAAVVAFLLMGLSAVVMIALFRLGKDFGINVPVEVWASVIGVFLLSIICGAVLFTIQAIRERLVDPNTTPVEPRIERGRQEALTEDDFHRLYPNADLQFDRDGSGECQSRMSD